MPWSFVCLFVSATFFHKTNRKAPNIRLSGSGLKEYSTQLHTFPKSKSFFDCGAKAITKDPLRGESVVGH